MIVHGSTFDDKGLQLHLDSGVKAASIVGNVMRSKVDITMPNGDNYQSVANVAY